MLNLNKDTLLLEASLVAIFIAGHRLPRTLRVDILNSIGSTGYFYTCRHMVPATHSSPDTAAEKEEHST